ncbi:hypothetical protein V8F20_009102 [Naviculisporaceae sp. PSN 640]
MKLVSASALAAAFLILKLSSARFPLHNGIEIGPPIDGSLSKRTVACSGHGTINQLIDHANPQLGTFQQRYWYNSEWWKGPGSPIYLLNTGEQSGDGFNDTFLTTQRLPGRMAAETGGAVVIMEHRYWGQSMPVQNTSTQNMRYLTLDNALKDINYFAKHFSAPWDKTGGSKPSKAPWIYAGGSYAGALGAWLAVREPGTIWASYVSSAVVEAIGDYWNYFTPIQEVTPKNCSSDVNAVYEYIDNLLATGSVDEKTALKGQFMLGNLTDQDFGYALAYGPYSWQGARFSGPNSFYEFCDYVENVWPTSDNPAPGPEGVGLTKALDGYARFVREKIIPGYCQNSPYLEWQGVNNTGCFENLNPDNPVYRDLSSDNWGNRQWSWLVCNEPFEWWQGGAPNGTPTLVSRHFNVSYWLKQCDLHFPERTYGVATGRTAADVNSWTGGWSVTNTTRVMHTNGEFDPWREASLASNLRPGGPVKSTKQLPHHIVKNGTHCNDIYAPNWAANPALEAQIQDVIATMKKWIKQFYTEKKIEQP